MSRFGLASMIIALISHGVGLATPEWAINNFYHHSDLYMGLWLFCDGGNCLSMSDFGNWARFRLGPFFQQSNVWNDSAFVFASQAFSCIALALFLLGVFTYVLYTCGNDSKYKYNKLVRLGIVIVPWFGCGCLLISIIVFGEELIERSQGLLTVGYSLGLSILGSLTSFIAGTLGFFELRSSPTGE